VYIAAPRALNVGSPQRQIEHAEAHGAGAAESRSDAPQSEALRIFNSISF
jgi:hypothetical protein